MKIVPVSAHHVLVFWVQVVALLTVARLLGAAMKRAGQAAVVGHLAPGLVLGPSVLGKVWPEALAGCSHPTRCSPGCSWSSGGSASPWLPDHGAG